MIIRREAPHDERVVEGVHGLAFGGDADAPPVEVALLAALRTCDDWIPELSLVACDPGSGDIAGHVVCTRARVGDIAVLGLGPIGVVPDAQGRGVGTALMHAVLGAADALDAPLVGLLGSPGLYRRFGFVTSTEVGVVAPDASWGEHFQARPLAAWSAAVRGPFTYAAPFDEIE